MSDAETIKQLRRDRNKERKQYATLACSVVKLSELVVDANHRIADLLKQIEAAPKGGT